MLLIVGCLRRDVRGGGPTLARGVRCGCGGCELDRVGVEVSLVPLTCLAFGQAVLSPRAGRGGAGRRRVGVRGVRGERDVAGDAEEEVGRLAGAFAALHSGGEGVVGGGGDSVDGFVVELGFGEEVEEFVGDGREVVGDDEAGAGGAGGFEGEEALFDVGAGEPEGERFEGGFVLVGDVAEGEVLGGEVVEDGGGGGGIEEGSRGGGEKRSRGIEISRFPCPFPRGRGVCAQ
jgi:hypothetical protein